MASSDYEQGLAVRREVLGPEHVDKALKQADDFSQHLQDFVTEYCWGTVWCDDTLDRKTRSIINLALLAGLPRPAELRLHLRGALNNGVSKEEIAAVFLQVAVYAGVPCAVSAFGVAREVFAEVEGGG